MPPEKPLRVIVVDDEPPARQRLCRLLQAEGVPVAAECADGPEALAVIVKFGVDLVFLDVQMPEMDGFELLRAIPPDIMPVVVFVTAHDRYAIQAFESNAVDYLLKPFRRERFVKALEWARSQASLRELGKYRERMGKLIDAQAGSRLMVRDGRNTVFLQHAEIVWIEAADNYACVHCGARTYVVRETLSSLERRLENTGLVRIHRSAILNSAYIREIHPIGSGDCEVVLRDGSKMTWSRTYGDRRQLVVG